MLAGCGIPAEPPAGPEAAPSPIETALQASNADAATLYRVVETWFNDYLALNPLVATELGDDRFDDRFGDYASASWMADSLGIEQEALERLATVDPARLDEEDRISYAAFRHGRELAVHGYRYPSELLAIDPFDERLHALARLAAGAHPFRTTRDYDDFLARMDGFVAWSEQVINNLRAGVSKGVVLPKAVVERTLLELEPYTHIDDPRQSVFWQPLFSFPAGPSVAERRRLLRAYDEKLRATVVPAYRRLHEYLAQEYLPHARDSIAWSALPSGDLWYAYLVRLHTTTTLTPDAVHEIGLREVAGLLAQLGRLQPASAKAGDARAVLDAWRDDSRFTAHDVRSAVAAYRSVQPRVESRLSSLFPRAPQSRLVVRARPAHRAGVAGVVSYQPSSVDGTRPAVLYVDPSQPSYAVEPQFLRDGIPGRHYQASMARQATGLPSFRRFGRVAAYADGWATYAETLGPALGLYADPDAQFGALASELLHAARLVVDTGIHAQGWSRQRAADYLRANTALRAADIRAEVDRYVARPGEALAYKVGQLEILELRRTAEQRLETRFDVREFHTLVLDGGVLPLRVLEERIERWLDSRS